MQPVHTCTRVQMRMGVPVGLRVQVGAQPGAGVGIGGSRVRNGDRGENRERDAATQEGIGTGTEHMGGGGETLAMSLSRDCLSLRC